MNIRGPYCKIKYERINPNSHEQVKEFLLSVGWVPTQWNINKKTKEPTSPKLTEDSFSSIKGELGQLVARRNVLVHRRRTIENLKDPENRGILSKVRDDGRVAAEGMPCATPTGRTTHSGAVCNVPKAKPSVIYGKEMRSLFRVWDPYVMIGADLAQIEARVTAHWASLFDGGAYWHVINSVPDLHQYNADLIQNTRDVAKSFQYAIFYGARAPKLSRILGCSEEKAEEYIDSFWSGNLGVKMVVDYLAKFFKKHKYIVGLDGRKIQVRQEYKLLNTAIQSTAALIFKMWLINTNRMLEGTSIYCRQMLEYHDEAAYRCLPEHAEEASRIIKLGANMVQDQLNLIVPIDADVKSGMTWAEVH